MLQEHLLDARLLSPVGPVADSVAFVPPPRGCAVGGPGKLQRGVRACISEVRGDSDLTGLQRSGFDIPDPEHEHRRVVAVALGSAFCERVMPKPTVIGSRRAHLCLLGIESSG